ncbi:MAG TPA: glucose-1-phosphate adenylyltransferase [Polyangiaceae bacterium]|nr:glucose-1-phosphate adenylyltransferase [Polyangiaceae bacterium]HNZ22162.1 glucose-1-phosphate adenylyltransferase [Polyangiaceae bacterium]HOD21342.1 glucose-1-phosphate adenylyltransferase [Polyangiaceae bacterium]HOE46986.1 glucose-1-phosphate adenylyltransferase [Polyangiaceae bacterium]HOG99831.1 glucose-1-phosphate adenylyltransferase [Polyangiaceae bacterium]
MTPSRHRYPLDVPHVLGMILAGGEGRRLGPLTADRAKAAISFGGRYRLIDIVLSNFVNSGIVRIKILTQYKSASLEEHVARAWRMSAILDNFIETIPAQQRTGKSWFKGSVDAVYQTQHVISDEAPDIVCVFGSDHVYKMDLRQMLAEHLDVGADCTVAAIPIAREKARAFGCVTFDDHGSVTGFVEKPENPPPIPSQPHLSLVSMGNYVFNATALLEELELDSRNPFSTHDFGRDLIPAMHIAGRKMHVYDFTHNRIPGESEHERGYWLDVGTVDSYWAAHMDLVSIHPHLNLYNPRWPIRTAGSHDPPPKFVFRDEASARVGIATDSLVSGGSIISGGRIHKCVLGRRVRINSFSEVEESILFDEVSVGRYARIRRAIVEKGVQIPPGVEIGLDLESDKRKFHVSAGGVVVVPKNAVFSKG